MLESRSGAAKVFAFAAGEFLQQSIMKAANRRKVLKKGFSLVSVTSLS